MQTQEFVKFELNIPKERQDLIDAAKLLFEKVKDFKRLDNINVTNNNEEVLSDDIENNERIKEFKQLFSGFVVKEIPKKEDLDYIRIKRYVK